jgi:hypothetical protein
MQKLFGFSLLALISTFLSFSAQAGLARGEKMVCENERVRLTIETRGGLFGKNQVILEENRFFGSILYKEAYDKKRIPLVGLNANQEMPEVLQIALRENGSSRKAGDQLAYLKSAHLSIAIYSGEKTTLYLREKGSSWLLQYDFETECSEQE